MWSGLGGLGSLCLVWFGLSGLDGLGGFNMSVSKIVTIMGTKDASSSKKIISCKYSHFYLRIFLKFFDNMDSNHIALTIGKYGLCPCGLIS